MLVGLLLIQLLVNVLASGPQCGRFPLESSTSRSERYASERRSLIIDGKPARQHSRPWQVAIQYKETEGICCGGSLIAPQWVLTAAHCLRPGRLTQIFIHAGAHVLGSNQETDQTTTAESFHLHPDFRFPSNDIGLIKLSTPFEYTDSVQPICLSSEIGAMADPGASVILNGWGDTSRWWYINGNTTTHETPVNRSLTLLEVTLKIVSNDNCADYYRGFDDTLFCAGDGRKDTCQGDSGGPAIAKGPNGSWFQVGIVSGGRGCGDPRTYGLYNRAYKYCDWIEGIIEEKICLSSIYV